jgi:O-acetylserine/cysteine efflux transporter
MTRRDALLALVPPLCWGTGFAMAKPAVAHFPPLMMMGMVYAGIALALFFTRTTRIVTPWRSLVLIAAFSMPIQGVLLFMGLRQLDVTTATLVLQSQVPMAVVLGWLIAGENFTARKFLGTVVALAGLVAVIGLPEARPPLLPVVMVLLGALAWAFGQVLTRLLGHDDGLTQFKGLTYAALPQLILASAAIETGHVEAIMTADRHDWLALAFVGVIGFYAAYAVWYVLLRRCRVDDLAPFVLLMPVFGIAFAWLVLGETVSAVQIAGGAVILAGLAIVAGLDGARWRSAVAKD